MALSWSNLANYFGQTEEQLQTTAIAELLKSELANLDASEADLIRRYGVLSAGELEQLLNSNSVPEHPAWEHLIEWETIEDRRQQVRKYMSQLQTATDGHQ